MLHLDVIMGLNIQKQSGLIYCGMLFISVKMIYIHSKAS